MTIRDEDPADAPGIRALVASAFGQAAEADLVDRLRRDGDGVISLVAVEDGAFVGHVLLSRMRAPFRALGLAPVSVTPERQRAGIGSRLIRAALDRARGEEWQGVFVLGEPAYYRRFGFDSSLAGGFASPYAGPYLMALALRGELPARTGRIVYAPAFAALG
ncbi:MAG TPA: N-acetyltransferase [Microvirga sp.]|jgi:putative acetyltransferase|nr:N-acetyltransferase [Microvirga sp.]